MKVYQYEVSIHTTSLWTIRLAVFRVSRVSYQGQPCEYTSNGYTRQRAKLAMCIASAISI